MNGIRSVLLICLGSPFLCHGQIISQVHNSGYVTAGAYSLRHTDAFSFTGNQASLAQLKNTAAGIYGERKFLLNDLNSYTAVAAIGTSSGNFGIETFYTGSPDHNETTIGLAYGRRIGAKADIGVQFNYNSIRLSQGYGNASAISFEAGFIFHLTDKLHTGLHINNPAGGKFGSGKQEKLPSVYTVGFGFDASEKLMLSAEIVKEENQPVNVNAGIAYKFIPQLFVKTGIASATSSVWFGAGLLLGSFRIEIVSGYHPQLGITPGLLLLFNFKQEKK
jgi:hypothetical protein